MGTNFNQFLQDALRQMDEDARARAEKFAESLESAARPDTSSFVPTIPNLSRARNLVDDMMETVEEWRKSLPTGKTFVIGMETPDGRYMIARKLGWVGNECFVAHGWVDGVDCMVTGHISKLSVLCAEMNKSVEVGFTAKIAPASEKT